MTLEQERITIRLNGEEIAIESGWSLATLLENLKKEPRTVAVERNGAIVPRGSYPETALAEGDRLEIVHFVQGG